MINEDMTGEQCRAEALRRLAESDLQFEAYKALPESQQGELSPAYNEVCHLRQTAAALAALAY